MALGLTFKSLIHIEFILVCVALEGSLVYKAQSEQKEGYNKDQRTNKPNRV